MKFQLPTAAAIAVMLACAASPSQAALTTYYTNLGPEAVDATGTGSASATFDDATNIFTFAATFSGLSGLTTQAHFHCCTGTPLTGTAGVAVDSPTLNITLGVSAGSFSDSLDLDDVNNFNPDFVNNSGGTVALAIARFKTGLDTGEVYLNIHSTIFRAGEIRGFMSVPEPASMALTLMGLAALGALGARKRSI
jgi:hypothetical protein